MRAIERIKLKFAVTSLLLVGLTLDKWNEEEKAKHPKGEKVRFIRKGSGGTSIKEPNDPINKLLKEEFKGYKGREAIYKLLKEKGNSFMELFIMLLWVI